MRKTKRSRNQTASQTSLQRFEEESKKQFLSTLSQKKLSIIQLLDKGFYKAAIARKTGISKSYVSKFVNELHYEHGLISVEFLNPLTHRAVSYRVTPELKEIVSYAEKNGNLDGYTLAIPHKLRYKYRVNNKTKPFSDNTGRFANAKLKLLHVNTYMRGGIRYYYTMRHDTVGDVGVTVHPNSIEVYQKHRKHIQAKSSEEATNILAMALNDVAQRFVQEQSWENVHMDLGQPVLVTSPHYAFNSKLARRVVERGQTNIQVGEGCEIDDSLKKKGVPDVAEIETEDVDVADIIDKGLHNAANIDKIVPALVKEELKSVSEMILNMDKRVGEMNTSCNNVIAACQSGMTQPQQFTMLQTIVAQQGVAIADMQKSILKLVDNMGKVIDHITTKQDTKNSKKSRDTTSQQRLE